MRSLVVMLLLLSIGCKKSENTTSSSKKDLLISGSWKIAAVVADEDANGSYETDRFATFTDCYKDNFLIFKSNGELEGNEGPTKCDAADQQIMTTSWQLTQNETHLAIGPDEYKLEELTSYILKWKESFGGGRSTLVTFTKR